MQVKQALGIGKRLFVDSDTPELDAQLLLAHCLDKSRTWLFTWPEAELSNEQHQAYQQLCERRANGEPIAYILDEREFWGLALSCNPSTLIPRADTEVLVEAALELCELEQATVVDLGCGTGAIALALASEKPNWHISAVDFNADAVQLACKNRDALGLTKVEISQGDWLADFAENSLDLIVSNPPYIDPDDHHLDQGDVRFEPNSALIADNKGLKDIETIISQAQICLKDNGLLMFEHGYDQERACKALIESSELEYLGCRKDYGGNPRVSIAAKPLTSEK